MLDRDGRPIDREPRAIQWDPVSAEKGGYDRFMQKEIFEQPRAITDTIGTRVLEDEGDLDLDGIDLSRERVAAIEPRRAGRLRHRLARLPRRQVHDRAARRHPVRGRSRQRVPLPRARSSATTCLVIPVSQSGETADTLAALREGKAQGARVLAICNVRDATIARESHDVLYTHAGPEIGVASTKAFTTQVVALYLLAVKLGRVRGTLGARGGAPPRSPTCCACRASSSACSSSTSRCARSRRSTCTRATSSSSAAASWCRSPSRARSS